MVSTSATQFILARCFSDVLTSPCEALVSRLGIFLEEGLEKQKIPLNYALKYAPVVTYDGKFHCKYLRYSVNPTLDVFRMCRRVLVKLMFYGSELS